jgi:hypothetical protein
MSEPHRHRYRHQHRAPAPLRSKNGRAARFGRAGAASLVALLGLAVIVLGPTALALGWHTHNESQAELEAERNPVGSQVREGSATFVVEEVRCGAHDDTVHGQRCEVEIHVRNDGGEELTVPGIAQVLVGPEGVRYLPVTGDEEPFGTLQSGEWGEALLEYDLPPHARVTHVSVHQDIYSEGDTVALGGPPLPLVPVTD